MKKQLFPQPDFARSEWLNLNGAWEFSFDEPRYDRTIEVPYPWGSPLSGIEESKNGTGFYRRTAEWNPAGERIFLIFGAVDYTCVVRVNGAPVGSHRGGYAPFEFDVTDLWKRDGENTVEVSATDTAARSQTYGKQGYGDARGIWQTVRLEARPAAYLASFRVETKLDGTVTYEIETAGAPDGSAVNAAFGEITGTAQVTDNRAVLTLHISDPLLWTPEEPNLYDGTLTLTADGKSDVVSTYFGVREIGTGVFGEHGVRYLTLNGKPYYLNGVLDQSFNPKGFFTLPSDEDCKEEILRLKRIGINMARIHIKAEEPLKLYYADRLGLLIMEDLPCFWGDPEPDTCAQYEKELEWQVTRDRNHPAVFYWVVFNETWGLFTRFKDETGAEKREYKKETAEWVEKCCRRVKALDPTRPVEDNSVCNRDHTVTDVNTWHFYSNGYTRVKGVIDGFCKGAYVGSKENYKEGYTMGDVPCMNSECGNVWGVTGNAGESDISWQYKYMMNEFRLHDKLGGFVFTEFHDVVNEFNGYYKIDNSDKDFGYDEYGMTIRDLHSQDYLGADYAPMTTVKPGDVVTLPMFGSSFTDLRHKKTLEVMWQLRVNDPVDGDYIADDGVYSIVWNGYGTFPAGAIRTVMPDHDGTALLSWTLCDGGERVMSNGVLFDIASEREDCLSLEPKEFEAEGFTRAFDAQEGNKKNGLGCGALRVTVKTADIPGFAEANSLRLLFEASTRAPMTHDFPDGAAGERTDGSYMLGYRCDPGANRNSFPQTDEVPYPGTLEVELDGERFASFALEDCPADSRGALSHHYQAVDNLLDEAGSYGRLCDVKLPSRLLMKLKEKDSFTLTFRETEESGLSLFGRKSGRYGIGVILKAE